VVITPMGDAWQDMSASSFEALQSTIAYYIHPRFYTLAFQWLMMQPAFAVFLVLSLLLWMAATRSRRWPVASRPTRECADGAQLSVSDATTVGQRTGFEPDIGDIDIGPLLGSSQPQLTRKIATDA
jgi:hypothetical protein